MGDYFDGEPAYKVVPNEQFAKEHPDHPWSKQWVERQQHRHVGYLLPVGAMICLDCAKQMPGVENWSEPVRSNWPEIEIDNADCDCCGESLYGSERPQ